MLRRFNPSISHGAALVCFCLGMAWSQASLATEPIPTAEEQRQREFFEVRIRPVLVEHCYQCHNSRSQTESSLALDSRAGLLRGGAGGLVLIPGDPDKSRLLATMRHDIDGLKMPDGGPKLDPQVIADFHRWIADGAFDPRDQPPTPAELKAATSWDAIRERRQQWWSFQPIVDHQPPTWTPTAANADWARHPIDRFIKTKWDELALSPAPLASPSTIVRRLYFNLIGLPPTPAAAQRWSTRLTKASAAERQAVYEELVTELLESPRFGERWARHWLDWIRYAESHGSEGDPEIVAAWQYRDYLIRALNADVPVDQLLREHIAGDLLPTPRCNDELGIVESAIGPTHWRMVYHGFAPTDALEEKVRFVDDQINAFSKAFLGLTVSCARCHDHKFDAISQADYYALFGVLASCRPGRTVVDMPKRQQLYQKQLTDLKPLIRQAVADDWLAQLPQLPSRFQASIATTEPASQNSKPPLNRLSTPLRRISDNEQAGVAVTDIWQQFVKELEQIRPDSPKPQTPTDTKHWRFADPDDYRAWFRYGIGLPPAPVPTGDFAVAADDNRAIVGIYPAGIYSHRLSSKHPARLTSPDFQLNSDWELWVLACGAHASLRYAVQDYPRDGTVYPVIKLTDDWRWHQLDLSYWSGDSIYIELVTAGDAPLLVKQEPRSWFGIREAVLVRKGRPLPRISEPTSFGPRQTAAWSMWEPIRKVADEQPPTTLHELVEGYTQAIESALQAWRTGSVSDAQALLLDACLREGWLTNDIDAMHTAKPLLLKYRQLEEAIPVPTRVPGLEETAARPQPLFVRGDHRQPADLVPRRFLEAIDPKPYESLQSGRLELADDLVRRDNPFTRRVLVNRVWHHLFGRGLVSTTDNFGRLGEPPSHPELLDWLALRFERDGWSLKQLIRLIVTSRTWQLAAESPTTTPVPPHSASASATPDPENKWLTRANVRRLEAEAIRDTFLSVAGQRHDELGGPPVSGNSSRRSVYVQVRRNALDPFLRIFDFPEPFSTVGRRDVTNVPAQSLTLLNDPRLLELARSWAQRLLAETTEPSQRIHTIFWTAFGRPPNDMEIQKCLQYLEVVRDRSEQQRQRLADLQRRLTEKRRQRSHLVSPIQQQVLSAKWPSKLATTSLPERPTGLLGYWDFTRSLQDEVGEADASLYQGATRSAGGLQLEYGGYAVTKPIQRTLTAKTLSVWVQLANLEQQGGGAMSIQSQAGEIFDAIVYGELNARQWLAGSDNFRRTKSFGGPVEESAMTTPIHFAIIYHADGKIAGYRNGELYGAAYNSMGPQRFTGENTIVGFGIRHLPAGGNRMLAGTILNAYLFDRALADAEIAGLASEMPNFVTDAEVLAQMSAVQRQELQSLDVTIVQLESAIAELATVPGQIDDTVLWTELCRAVFTMKEMIYVR